MASLEKPGASRQRPRAISNRKMVLASILVCILLALALGLGLGLGLKAGHEDTGLPPPATAGSPNATSWQPAVGASWQIILSSPLRIDSTAPAVTPDVEIWDLDLFDNPAATFKALQGLGKRVICYFSAGSYEPNRPDSDRFTKNDMGFGLEGWPGEVWLNTSSNAVRNIMKDRIRLASEKGCDAIDPDNVDAFQNENGLDLTPSSAVEYVRFLAMEAQKYNMSIGLKNAADIIESVLPIVSFSVNEQCTEHSECGLFSEFIRANKPVFHIEYSRAPAALSDTQVAEICSRRGNSAGSDRFSTVLKTTELDGWVRYCNGTAAQTPSRGK